MPHRLVQVSVPRDAASPAMELLRVDPTVGSWSHPLDDARTLVSVLVDAKQCEGILDRLGSAFPRESIAP